MLEAKVYSSQAPSTPKALLDIGSEFHRDALDADFILVFASAHHANGGQQLNDALKDIFGDTPFLGWFGTSAYYSDLIPEWQPALVFMALKGINAHVSSASTHALGSHVGVSLLADSPTGEHRFLCLNSEPIDFEGLLTTLDEQAVPLTGAISLSPKNVERLIICSAAYNQDHAVAIASLSNLKMVWQIAHGTRLLGEKHHITTGENNLIFELDGRPALEVLLEELPPALHQSLPQLGGSLFVGLATPDGDEWLMRPISGIDPNHGALMITDQCHPHEEVAFFIKDTKAAQANMQDAVDNLKMSLAHQTPRALVLFNCTSRDEKMMGAPLFDVRALKEAFTPNLPLVGIAGGGEFSTVGRQSHLFQYCSVIVALTEDHSDVE